MVSSFLLMALWTAAAIFACSNPAYGLTLDRDVDALRLLKEEVQYRDPYWAGLVETWSGGGPDGSDDPCGMDWVGNWEGVECRYQSNMPADVPRVVTGLHITDRQLSGPVPLAVALLQNLTEIDMDGNKLEGPLNPYMGCLPNLRELDLANNTLWGSIPLEWGFLTSLIENELEDNPNLSGCIPVGLPRSKTMCSIRNDVPFCELVGTITFDTGLGGFCDKNLSVEKKCASWDLVRGFINEGRPYDKYFRGEHDGGNI